MCDIPLLIGLVLAGETTFLAAAACILGVVLTSSNPFTAGGSPILVAVAIGLILASVVLMNLVVAALNNCGSGSGGCAQFASRVRGFAIALAVTLTAMAVTTAFMLPVLAIPFGGSAAAIILAATMIAAAVSFAVIADALRSLELCVRGANTVASAVVLAISVVGVVVGMLVSGSIFLPGGPPCTGPNC